MSLFRLCHAGRRARGPVPGAARDLSVAGSDGRKAVWKLESRATKSVADLQEFVGARPGPLEEPDRPCCRHL